ncbi:MAG: UDP-N-acetylmuramoyl-L-alanyl-D-glutamate--2,6-diaminopimelate ligase [Chloroflexi bacterium]|nr:UDP-N-acetylmuramoyl-L-alanyl-D-glutamate--2,6-diaminopimelate ligase [Chloroflexota bacterium]
MKSVKRVLKKIIPSGLFARLLPLFHKSQSVFYNLLFGFPGRKLKVIAVTGTNGKTTTVSYIASILQANGDKVGVSTTSYQQIGDKVYHNKENRTVADPLKVFWLLRRMRMARVDWVVLEVTSHALDQHRLWGVPIYAAVMTNLTQDHLDYHKTMENYAAAKAKLFENDVKFVALNADDEWFDYYNDIPVQQKMSYGTSKNASAHLSNIKLTPSGSHFSLTLDHTVKLDFKSSLIGQFNVYNAAAAATIAYMFYIDKSAVVKGIAEMQTVPGRMEPIGADIPYNLIIDFAHTPDGLEKVLETLKDMTNGRLILVFGGIGNRDDGERPMMGEIAARFADRIILTDDEPYDKDVAWLRKDVMKGIKKGKGTGKTTEVDGRRNGIKKALDIAKKDDTVVITGMGDYDFVKVGDGYEPWNDKQAVVELLQEKGRLQSTDKKSE